MGKDVHGKQTLLRETVVDFDRSLQNPNLYHCTVKTDAESTAASITLYHEGKKIEDLIAHKTKPKQLELDSVVRIKIADVIGKLYNDAPDPDAHQWFFPRFNERAEEIFGKRAVADSPIDGRKQIRKYCAGLSSNDLLKLLQYLIDKDGIEGALGPALAGSSLKIVDKKIVSSADYELGIYDTAQVIGELQKLGWNDVARLLEESEKDLQSNPLSAATKAGLAFDSVGKKALSYFQINFTGSMGALVNELVRNGIVEADAQSTFQSLATLRNKQSGHAAGGSGAINSSSEIAYLSTYLSRLLIGYIIRRLTLMGKI